jgi:hypothetical protein
MGRIWKRNCRYDFDGWCSQSSGFKKLRRVYVHHSSCVLRNQVLQLYGIHCMLTVFELLADASIEDPSAATG